MTNTTQYFPALDDLESYIRDAPKVSITQHPGPMIGMGFGFVGGQPMPFTVGAGSPVSQVPIRLQFSTDYHPVMRSIDELLVKIESSIYGPGKEVVLENIKKWLSDNESSNDECFKEILPLIQGVSAEWEKFAYVNTDETERTLRRLHVNINQLLPEIEQPIVGRAVGEVHLENQIFDQQIRNLTAKISETRELIVSNNYLSVTEPELKSRVESVFDDVESDLRDLIAANDLSNDPVPVSKIEKITNWFSKEWCEFHESLGEFLPKKRVHELIIKGGLMAALLTVGAHVLPILGINPALGATSAVALFIGGEIKYSELMKRLMSGNSQQSSSSSEEEAQE